MIPQIIKCFFGKHNVIVEGELYRNYWRNTPLDTFTLFSISRCKCCDELFKIENRGDIPFDIVMERPTYLKLIKRN